MCGGQHRHHNDKKEKKKVTEIAQVFLIYEKICTPWLMRQKVSSQWGKSL